jgi:hypothetical protein
MFHVRSFKKYLDEFLASKVNLSSSVEVHMHPWTLHAARGVSLYEMSSGWQNWCAAIRGFWSRYDASLIIVPII